MTPDTPAAQAPIVIGDAEPEPRARLAAALRQRGVEVLEAENGLEVLLFAKRARPRAVIVTLDLPRVNGPEVLRRIRQFDPDIRVILVGTPGPDTLTEGASAVLRPPLEANEILTTVARPPAAAPVEPAASAPKPSPSRGRVLIVDDNTDFCAIVEEALAALGHAAQIAGDAASALRLITQGAPDVVLLDIDLPGLSGIAALPAIHAIAPAARIIMVRGTNDDVIARRSLAAGAFDYLVKPIDLTRLAEVVDLALLF